MASEKEPDERPRVEQPLEYLPSPDDLAKIKSFYNWIDGMHDRVRGSWGSSWVEIQLMVASATDLLDWVASNPDINPRYRYRIDAPMDPDTEVPDHLPDDWRT